METEADAAAREDSNTPRAPFPNTPRAPFPAAVINDSAKACSPIAASCSVAPAYMCGCSDLISSSDLRARVMTQALYT